MDPLKVIYQQDGGRRLPLPGALHDAYGGGLDLDEDVVYVNFVSSVDGVVALEEASPAAIGLGSRQDRFLMALLRACCDAILVGASTLRAEKDHPWTAQYLAAGYAAEFGELRKSLGKDREPLLAVATRSADLPPDSPALKAALVLTCNPAYEHLAAAGIDVALLSDSNPRRIVDELHRRGCRTILCEGGPTLLGELLGEDLVDEIFLTLSPAIAGRDSAAERPGLVAGRAFSPKHFPVGRLISARVADSHLFLRYRLRSPQPRKRPGH